MILVSQPAFKGKRYRTHWNSPFPSAIGPLNAAFKERKGLFLNNTLSPALKEIRVQTRPGFERKDEPALERDLTWCDSGVEVKAVKPLGSSGSISTSK